MNNFSVCKFAFALLPVIGIAATRQEWEATQTDRDMYRMEAAWRAFDFAQTTRAVTNITTNVVFRDSRLAAAEAKYIETLAAAGLSTTNDFDAAADAINAGATTVGSLKLAVRLMSLRLRIQELGGNPAQATGRTAETNTASKVEIVPK